jgi:hypothetical protein
VGTWLTELPKKIEAWECLEEEPGVYQCCMRTRRSGTAHLCHMHHVFTSQNQSRASHTALCADNVAGHSRSEKVRMALRHGPIFQCACPRALS